MWYKSIQNDWTVSIFVEDNIPTATSESNLKNTYKKQHFSPETHQKIQTDSHEIKPSERRKLQMTVISHSA